MKLTIVYDNEVYKKGFGLKSNWGFSCLLETKNDKILFDCGAKGKILLNNMEKLRINPKEINKIVISHEHWDHNGGLKSIIALIKGAELYSLEKTKINEKIKFKLVKESEMILEGVYTTGRLEGSPIDEQSLVLKGKKGYYVIVGCSHSGVENILYESKKFGKVIGIIGGFHGFEKFNVLNDLDLISPCHCTKYKKSLEKLYPKKFIKGGVGKVFEL